MFSVEFFTALRANWSALFPQGLILGVMLFNVTTDDLEDEEFVLPEEDLRQAPSQTSPTTPINSGREPEEESSPSPDRSFRPWDEDRHGMRMARAPTEGDST